MERMKRKMDGKGEGRRVGGGTSHRVGGRECMGGGDGGYVYIIYLTIFFSGFLKVQRRAMTGPYIHAHTHTCYFSFFNTFHRCSNERRRRALT